MNALSVIKIPIMVLAYRDADAGALDLEERYQIQPEDMRRGSGLLQSFATGIEPTYRDIITQMIITSDNTATDVVIKRLGLGRVNTMLEELGFEQTRLRATTGELFRAVLELADSSSASLSDREVLNQAFLLIPKPQFVASVSRVIPLNGWAGLRLGRSLICLRRSRKVSGHHLNPVTR